MTQAPTFYPNAERYFVQTMNASRPIFQGDLFASIFGANDSGDGTFGLLLPHPCDFAEDGKGAVQPQRLVAPVFPASRTKVPLKQLRSGSVGHLIWLPKWSPAITEPDWCADLRLCTSIEAAFLAHSIRLASMSPGSWLALNDKLTRYFTGIAVDRTRFVIQRSDLHPDCPPTPAGAGV